MLDSDRRFALALGATLFAVAGGAVVYANAVGATAQTLAPWVGALVAGAGFVSEGVARVGDTISVARLPLGLGLAVAAVFGLRGGRRSAGPLVSALGCAAIAEWLALDRELVWAAVFAVVSALVWLARPAGELDAPPARAGGWAEVGMIAVPVALYLALGVHRLDVFPTFYFDEGAYLNAALMQIGALEPGVVARYGADAVYDFDQFRFQRVPLWAQAASVAVLSPGLLALRLGSLVVLTAALVVGACALRERLSRFHVATLLFLAAVSPLALGYGRAGFYVAATVLHGAIAFAAVAWVDRRWDGRSAGLLGVLLGASLYFYQLSWFVPVLTALAVAASPELWRRPGSARLAIVAVGAAALVAIPGLWGMADGFDRVAAQTFDKAAWTATEGAPVAVVVAPDRLDADGAARAAETWSDGGLTAVASFSGVRPVVVFHGEAAGVDTALARAEQEGWHALGTTASRSPVSRVGDMLSRLAFRSDWESSGRWIDGPILDPWVVPLVWLGLFEAWRRRRDRLLRTLLVWVVAAAILPAALGGSFPRRAVLMLPFVFGLAALALGEVARAFRTAGRSGVGEAVLGVFLLLAAASNLDLYFKGWDQRISLGSRPHRVLELDKIIKEVPISEPVLAPRLFGRDWAFLHRAGRANRPLTEVVGLGDAVAVRERSCRETAPFTWAIPDEPVQRERFAALARDFALREDERGSFVLIRVEVRLPEGCSTTPPTAPR